MYAGQDTLTIDQLIQQVEEQHRSKLDVLVPTGTLEVRPPQSKDDPFQILFPQATVAYDLTRRAHAHLADLMGIPGGFYRKLQDGYPDELAALINGIGHKADP